MKGLLRRAALAGTTGVIGLGALSGVAHADTSTTLHVVGTSDVSDSGLMPNVIQPEFEQAFPQYAGGAFTYTGTATGTAIGTAKEAGSSVSPSVLIVHAASLENSFVSGGYSYTDPTTGSAYGSAIFRNDFVLAGPVSSESTKANVLATAPNNVAAAYAAVANAGVAGTATYVSRGGNMNASGTTVEEHQIWGLVDASGLLAPADSANFVLCAVSTLDGGGMAPIAAGTQVNGTAITDGQACPTASPDLGAPSSTDTPSWYHIASGNQAAAVGIANTCSFAGAIPGACYILTDRGTFDYLNTGGAPTPGPSSIANLQIVTRDNSPDAPGGRYELINYFHAYIINPSGPGNDGASNLAGAEDFVDFLTSPTFQSQVGNYLQSTGDVDGAPFVADASPIITASGLPSTVAPSTAVTVTGNVANAEVGYPTLADEPVSVEEIAGGLDIEIPGATATTDNNGNYSITFTPPSTGSYQVVTGDISQVENPSLSPIYGDVLSPSASAAKAITVQAPAATPTTTVTSTTTTTVPATTPAPVAAAATITSTAGGDGSAKVTGTVSPAVPDADGHIAILARKLGSTGAYKDVGGFDLRAAQTSFSIDVTLGAGKWQLEAYYTDPGKVAAATSKAEGVTVAAASTSAAITKDTVKTGTVTLDGKLSQAAPAAGTVELLAVQSAHLSGAKLTKVGSLKTIAKVSVKKGKATFVVSTKLARGYRYSVQLAYVQLGKATTYSKVSSLSVS